MMVKSHEIEETRCSTRKQKNKVLDIPTVPLDPFSDTYVTLTLSNAYLT